MIESPLFRVALAGLLVLASCRGAPDAEAPGTAESADLLTSEQTEPDLSGFASRQRAFLEAFADQQRDPTDLMSPHFTFRDRTNPDDAIRRGPGGVPGSGMDYVKALSERVSPIYAQAESMEVFQQRSGEVVVITRHPGVLPTVTRWGKQGSDWKATSFVINVDDAALAGFSGSR